MELLCLRSRRPLLTAARSVLSIRLGANGEVSGGRPRPTRLSLRDSHPPHEGRENHATKFDVPAVYPPRMDWSDQKIRSDESWDEIRRCWEAGETGASLARRYQVGLANLWRRRASESWRRPERVDAKPEPVEGWDRWARARLDEFELRLAEQRALAMTLAEAMTGAGPPVGTPLWHVGFVLEWRAEHLGAEAAAKDRAWLMEKHPWAEGFWDEEGRLRRAGYVDMLILMANREAWREETGVPDGVAEDVP